MTKSKIKPDKNGVIGAALDWGGRATLGWSDGKILMRNVAKIIYPQYFIDGEEYPINPVTKEKLPIARC